MPRMAMTAERRAVFARQASARFDRGISELEPVVKACIAEYLAGARSRFGAKGKRIPTLTAAANSNLLSDEPDPDEFGDDDVDGMLDGVTSESAWATILDRKLVPAIGDLVDGVIGPAQSMPGAGDTLTTWRNQWLKDRTQALAGIPDDITGQLRTALRDLATKKGTNVADAQDTVQTMLDDGYPSWSSRAKTIAQTETVGANNQGSLASWQAIADQQGMTATKAWLATEDARTRESHADIDGTEVDIGDTFNLGDGMNGPGDPNGPAEEVINCRCTLTYNFPDGTETDSAPDDADVDALSDDGGGDDSGGDSGDGGDDLTAAAAPQTGVAIMLGLGNTSEADFGNPPDVEPPGLHCTVAYLDGDAASIDPAAKAQLLANLALLQPEGTAQGFGTAQFNPDDPEREPCAVVLVQSDWLSNFREQVQGAIASADLQESTTFPIWIPHVAVAYNADVDVIPPTALTEIQFNRLVVGWGDEQIIVAGENAEPAPVDGPGQTDGDLTAATEAPMTAPAPTAAPPIPPPTATPEATGGDTAAPGLDTEPQGVTWQGPVALLDQPSSDGRVISSVGGTIRTLPQPLSWQDESDEAHKGSVIVGRVLACEVRGNVLWASGDYLDPMINFEVPQAMGQVDAGLGLVSVDLAVGEIGFAGPDGQPIDPALFDGDYDDVYEVALTWEFAGVTLVGFPAFDGVRITNDAVSAADAAEIEMETPMPILDGPADVGAFAGATPAPPTITDGKVDLGDGTTAAVGDLIGYPGIDGSTVTGTISSINDADSTVDVTPPPADDGTTAPDLTFPVNQLVSVPADSGTDGMGGDEAAAASLLASSEIEPYSAKAFEQRKLDGPTPLTVDGDQVYGHLALAESCHIGKLAETGKCVTMPEEPGGSFDYFHLSEVMTDSGLLDVGKITLGAGHAGRGGFAYAAAHYDNSAATVALVRAYRDEFGIQVTGQLVRGTEAYRIDELRRSPLSGDWRKVSAQRGAPLRLVAALAVNTPGFPVKRPRVQLGMVGDNQISLVAAGVVMRSEDVLDDIALPHGKITRGDFEALVASVHAEMNRGRNSASEAEAEAEARARFAFL